MRVVGLDLSLTAIGYCHGDGSTETISSRLRAMDRIVNLAVEIVDRLSVLRPALVVVEDYAFSRGNHAHETGELGGVVKLNLMLHGHPYLLVGPSSLKRFATGKGNASKTQMAVAAAKVGREFPNDDECDAFWLWQMAMYRYADLLEYEAREQVVARTAYRDEAVSKIDWPVLTEPVA